MFDKFSQALTLMREAFEDAQVGATSMASLDLAAEVDGAQQVINAASAVQVLRVAQYAARDEEQDGTGARVEVDHGVGHVSQFAADAFGPALAMGPVVSGRKVQTAAVLASKLPLTLAAMSAADLDSWRATIIAAEVSEASPASCAAVQALIHPAVLAEAPGAVTNPPQAGGAPRVRHRVLARIDADALRVKAAKARLDRFVHAYPSHVSGLTTWVASLPSADSAACWAAIDDLAHTMAGDDPTRTLEQCRADALVDLMLTNVDVTTTVTLMIPVQTVTVDEPAGALERDLLAGGQPHGGQPHGGGRDGGSRDGAALGYRNPLANTDDFGQPTPDPNPLVEPTWTQICAMGYEIPGIGWGHLPLAGDIGGDVVASILARFDTRIARVLLDEHTGVVIETATTEYLPNRAMRRFIRQRDGHRRFPGCNRGPKRCEPDHITAFSRGGPTAIWNLVSLVQTPPRVKHHHGWALTMTPQGHCTWTDPHHRQYATHPINHHQLAA